MSRRFVSPSHFLTVLPSDEFLSVLYENALRVLVYALAGEVIDRRVLVKLFLNGNVGNAGRYFVFLI